MNVTPATAFRLYQRCADLEIAAKAATDVRRALCRVYDTASTIALEEAARAVERQAAAWIGTVERMVAYEDAVERLSDMHRRPWAYSVAELLAERDTLRFSVAWCQEKGRVDSAMQVAA